MGDFDKRSEERRQVCVQAFASDSKDTFNIKCIIRDVSESGCMIVSSQVRDLPQFIQLVPEGFNLPLNGKIVWCDDKKAGITFLSPSKDDVLSLLKDHDNAPSSETDGDDPLLLEVTVQPLTYSERLANYAPPRK